LIGIPFGAAYIVSGWVTGSFVPMIEEAVVGRIPAYAPAMVAAHRRGGVLTVIALALSWLALASWFGPVPPLSPRLPAWPVLLTAALAVWPHLVLTHRAAMRLGIRSAGSGFAFGARLAVVVAVIMISARLEGYLVGWHS
jgi:hypothetical protein